jgi:hypothetical protein
MSDAERQAAEKRLAATLPAKALARFQKYAPAETAEQCWPWKGGLDTAGYGTFWFLGNTRAHRKPLGNRAAHGRNRNYGAQDRQW